MNNNFTPESNRLENKRQLTDSLEKEVTTFLNYRDGGVIYIGIDGETVGIENADQIQLKVKDRIKNNISNIRSRYQDLTFEQLKIYYTETPLKLNDKFTRNLELVTKEGD